MRQSKLLWCMVCLVSLAWLPNWLHAAETYPDHPISLIVPFATGSDADVIARTLAERIILHLDNHPIIVTYRPGASGSTAALAVREAPADGYTLLLGRSSTQAIAPAINPEMGYMSNDFTFLGVTQISPMICAVRKDSPYKTARELLNDMRQKPGSLKYGSSGTGTALNIATQYMLYLSGLKSDAATHVSYSDAPTVTKALLNGEVQFACNLTFSMLPHLKSGALRGLFTTSAARMDQLPNLQNAREIGLKDMENIIGWSAILGPANLPAPVVSRWQKALEQLANDPVWLRNIANLGDISVLKTPKNSNKFIQEQVKLYKDLVTMLKLRQ
jgi:tripartite-type tricarboxylate transporter receptor subunit TctC